MEKRGQITVFIIIGVVVLFAFLFVIMLTSSVKKSQLAEQQEGVLSQVFQKEALKIYLEDCLRDELEKGLLLLGKQGGRIWAGQPGGVREFSDGRRGIQFPGESEEQGGRIAYALIREDFPAYPNAYPCGNESFDPEFCRYQFPNTKVGFGNLVLHESTITDDLQRYLINRTQWCMLNFTMSNISEKAVLEKTDIELSAVMVLDGITVRASYPLKIRLGAEEFFHLATFDFFYPSQLKKLIDAAITFPLEKEVRYVDFSYDADTLRKPLFLYAGEELLSNCKSLDNQVMCSQNLFSDYYTSLGIELTKVETDAGEDIFIVKPALYTVLNSPEPFVFRFARQNRPPALDYINRSGCLPQYDYLAIKDDKELGDINITPQAIDPDEDIPGYYFDPLFSGLKNEDPFPLPSQFIVPSTKLNPGWYNVSVWSGDGFQNDWQKVRILVDRPIQIGISLRTSYEDAISLYSPTNVYAISVEDPVFLEVSLPQKSLTNDLEQGALEYNDGTITTSFDLPPLSLIPGEKYNVELPLRPKTGKYTEEDIKNIFQYESPFHTLAIAGKIYYTHTVNYCESAQQKRTAEAKVAVRPCVPHQNPAHPYPYMPGDADDHYKYEFAPDEKGAYQWTGKKVDINPFDASHTCCFGEAKDPSTWDLETPQKVCFVDPQPGCYGGTEKEGFRSKKGFTLEKRERYCDGTRGNICQGEIKYQAITAPNSNLILCGDPALSSTCSSSIPKPCRGKQAGSVIDEQGKKGICYGDSGCEHFCETVFVDNDGDTFWTAGDGCGCNKDNLGEKCDKDLDAVFEGVCTQKGSLYNCI
ncbi:hypothetical protein HYX14_01465 [Candidatus Woesearchaeota archaeon]|nr:hypothetical protein [Candidatus Woesearchaeota archaeon]